MKTFPAATSAQGKHDQTCAAGPAHLWRMVFVSLFLGMTALVVCFGAASAFEVRGRTSKGELIAPCVAAALYLAFCQFWVAPRGKSGFGSRLATLGASVAPLLLEINLPPRTWGIPWVVVSGCLGSVTGAMIAQWVTANPPSGIGPGDSSNRDRRWRRNLLAGFILLVGVALLILIGVIPSVLADTASDFNAGSVGIFLGGTVVFVLMVDGLLASALWRSRQRGRSSKGMLGVTAFLALLLAPVYCGFGVLVGGQGRGCGSQPSCWCSARSSASLPPRSCPSLQLSWIAPEYPNWSR